MRFSYALHGVGQGLATRVVRIRLEYDRNEATAPQTLIAKFPTGDPSSTGLLTAVGAYEREVRFYRELSERAGLPVPRCYFAEHASDSGEFVLLLEDLGLGASVGAASDIAVQRVDAVIEPIADFHAAWWGSAALSAHSWLSPSAVQSAKVFDIFVAALAACEAELSARAPSAARAARSLASRAGENGRRVPLRTLVHGDLHPSNLIFPGAGGGRFAVIDWQNVRAAESGASDVARLIVGGMDIDARRLHEGRLLDRYHRCLLRRGVTGFTREDLQARYRSALAEQVMGQVIVMVAFRDRAESRELLDVQLRRIEAAVADAGGVT